jgi:hypothetical protein
MNTRASNSKKHPGQVVLNSNSRRPKAVVEAERTSRAAKKKRLAAVQEEGINDVARIENSARKKKTLGPDASRQRNTVTIPRAKRAQKPRAATPVDQGELLPPSLKKNENSPLCSGYSDDGHTIEAEPQPEATERNLSDLGSELSAVTKGGLQYYTSFAKPRPEGLLQLLSNRYRPRRQSRRKSHQQ